MDEIEVLIISRKDVPVWVDSARAADNNSRKSPRIAMHYRNSGQKINDIFKPSISDAYAFILSNRPSPKNIQESNPKAVKVILTHSWQQKIKESQLKSKS